MIEDANNETLEMYRKILLSMVTEAEAELRYRKLTEVKMNEEIPEIDSDAYVRLEGVFQIISSNTQLFRFPPSSVSDLIALLSKLPKRIIKRDDPHEILSDN